MKIIPYGKLTDILETHIVSGESFADEKELRAWLLSQFPSLENEHFTIAVNQKLVIENQTFQFEEGDIIELLPPFSGG